MGKHGSGNKSLPVQDAKLKQKANESINTSRSAPQEPPQKTNAKNQYR